MAASDQSFYVIACARCCRYAQYRHETAVRLFGADEQVGELPFRVAAEAGCRWATTEHRNAYNFSLIKCDAALVPLEKCHSKLRDDVRRGLGITPP